MPKKLQPAKARPVNWRIYAAFSEEGLSFSGKIKPHPQIRPLYAKSSRRGDRLTPELHYLAASTDLSNILLQLWLYVKQDEARFKYAVDAVWLDYAKHFKFERGTPSDTEKFAAALKLHADICLSADPSVC